MDLHIDSRDIRVTVQDIISVQDDSNTQVIEFVFTKELLEYALWELNAFVIYAVSGSTGVRFDICTKTVTDSELKVQWVIRKPVTYAEGKLQFQVVFTDTPDPITKVSEHRWSTKIATVTIPKTLAREKYAIDTEPVIEQMMAIAAQCVEAGDKVSRAEAAAIRAEQAADSIQEAVDANNAAQAAKTETISAKNATIAAAQTAQLEAQKVKQIVAGNEAYTKQESDLKYTVAPRKEASSANGELKLTDADDGLSYLELQGNSEQYTNTANKNLIDLHFATDGYYVNNVNGALAVNPNYKASGYINVIPGESYFLTNASQASPGAMYNANKVYVQGLVNGLNVIPEGVKYVRISATIAGSTQFEKGTQGTEIVIGAVETPSPDYPSEVRSVGDIPKDVNGVEIRNLLDEEWIKNQPESAWTKDSSGTVFSIEVALPKTRLYIRTPDFNATDAEGTTFGISKRPGSLAVADGIYFYKTTLGSFDFSGQEHIYIILVRQDKNWDLAKKSLMKSRLMVTSAAEIDEYRPYIGENNGLVKIESQGINVVNVKDKPAYDAGTNNINIIKWTPQEIILDQKGMGTSYAYADVNLIVGKTYSFYCRAQVVTIEGSPTTGATTIGFKKYPPSGMMYGQTGVARDGTYHDCYSKVELPEDVSLMLYVNSTSSSGGNVRLIVKDLMVVEGDRTLQEMKALKYQPYYNKITWIPLREPLRGITGNNLKLYADKVDKNGYVTQNIYFAEGKAMFTFDTDALGINASDSPYKYAYWPMQSIAQRAYQGTISVLCNMLKRGTYNVNQMAITNTSVIVFNLPNTLTGLADAETDKAAITAAIKAWVNTNNPLVYYALNKPIEYQIPAIYIETYDQETNIRCLNKVKPSDMTLDYKIAMSSLIKRLEALEEKTVQEV